MKELKIYITESIFDIDNNIDDIDRSVVKKFLKDNFKGYSKCKISRKPNNDNKYEVSCSDDIEVKNRNITSLTNGTFIWTEVKGIFDCSYCEFLTSLEGAPKTAWIFNCEHCGSLKTLKGAPEKVGADFDCRLCKSLISLEGAPKTVGGVFCCMACNSLISLNGAPEEIGCFFNHFGCGKTFTENDVKKVSKVYDSPTYKKF